MVRFIQNITGLERQESIILLFVYAAALRNGFYEINFRISDFVLSGPSIMEVSLGPLKLTVFVCEWFIQIIRRCVIYQSD